MPKQSEVLEDRASEAKLLQIATTANRLIQPKDPYIQQKYQQYHKIVQARMDSNRGIPVHKKNRKEEIDKFLTKRGLL